MSTYALAIVGDQQLPGMEPYDPPTEQLGLFDRRDLPKPSKPAPTLTVGTQEGMI